MGLKLDFLQAVLLGVLQGVTEWLPISSSGHLVLAQQFFGVQASVFFDVALHAGTLAAVVLVFRKQIRELFSSDHKTLGLLALASVPVALAGFFLHDFFASLFSSVLVVGLALIATGCLLYATKNADAGKKAGSRKELGAGNSLLVGVAQAAAIIPGMSRSGATISTGMLAGVEKTKAATFSFLLSIPAIAGAAAFEAWNGLAIEPDLVPVALGVLAAFIAGYASIRWLLDLIKRKAFHKFAFYCWALGAIAVASCCLV